MNLITVFPPLSLVIGFSERNVINELRNKKNIEKSNRTNDKFQNEMLVT
jgi:hypothetical protein